jgi:hypothetical protein
MLYGNISKSSGDVVIYHPRGRSPRLNVTVYGRIEEDEIYEIWNEVLWEDDTEPPIRFTISEPVAEYTEFIFCLNHSNEHKQILRILP